MCKNDNRGFAGAILQIGFEPGELLSTQGAQAVLLDIHDVYKPDEVYSMMVETVPAMAFGTFSEALKVQLAVVASNIMFARDIEDLLYFHTLKQLVKSVKFIGAGKMGEIARVQNKIRLFGQGIDAGNCFLERGGDVGVDTFLVEADVRIADLHEAKAAFHGIRCAGAGREQGGTQQATAHAPEHAGAGPGHTFEESPAVQTVAIVVVQNEFFFCFHVFDLVTLIFTIQDMRQIKFIPAGIKLLRLKSST